VHLSAVWSPLGLPSVRVRVCKHRMRRVHSRFSTAWVGVCSLSRPAGSHSLLFQAGCVVLPCATRVCVLQPDWRRVYQGLSVTGDDVWCRELTA
jgi:hypothetical protein